MKQKLINIFILLVSTVILYFLITYVPMKLGEWSSKNPQIPPLAILLPYILLVQVLFWQMLTRLVFNKKREEKKDEGLSK